MKRIIGLALSLCFVLMASMTVSGEGTPSCYSKTQEVKFSGGSRSVKMVWVDLKDPTIRLEVLSANNQIGTVEPMKDIATQGANDHTKVLAAINGGFFNAYSDFRPGGTLREQGETLFFDTGVHFGVDGLNQPMMLPLQMLIECSINGSYEYPEGFGAWNLNYNYTDAKSTAIITPAYGKITAAHSLTSIVVEQGVVKDIAKGQAGIPSDGFVIVTGEPTVIARIKVGDRVDYRLKYYLYDFETKTKMESYDFANIRSGVSAGPTLLHEGNIVVNPVVEGFTEAKITTNRAQRSFIGYTIDQQLVMGTVNNVNLEELAEICKNLGLLEAMNLDGGASSGLMIGNQFLQTPGRNLSNIIVVTQLTQKPIRVTLNGREIYFDQDPYQDKISNRVMVPMRAIFETLGAAVSWKSDGLVTAIKDDTVIEIKAGSDIAIVNGNEMKLDLPVAQVGGRTFVPIRFITEQFGGTVQWQEDKREVILTIEKADVDTLYTEAVNLEKTGKKEEAISLYQNIIQVEPSYVDAYKKLGDIYNLQSDHVQAVVYYEKVISLGAISYDYLGKLGWAYYGKANSERGSDELSIIQKAMNSFSEQIRVSPTMIGGYYGLGVMNADVRTNNPEEAKEYFNIALTMNPTAAQKDYMTKYIAVH